MQSYSGIRVDTIMGKNLFDVCDDLPKEWLVAKLNASANLKTKGFSCWEDRPNIFNFKNFSPVTNCLSEMYQNMVITPLRSLTGEVTHLCIVINDVTDVAKSKIHLRDSNHKLAQISKTDGLTGLLNRSSWEHHLIEAHQACSVIGTTSTLVMFDIDHFKIVNDTFGHCAGDSVIKATADAALHTARANDYVGRYGGEEFAVILLDTNEDQALYFAERLRKKIEKMVVNHDDINIEFRISLGIAQFNPKFENHKMWIEAADDALYQSKESGRNQTNVFKVTA
jgi:diguanylate cyclase (GGDEF)-like protein